MDKKQKQFSIWYFIGMLFLMWFFNSMIYGPYFRKRNASAVTCVYG